MFLSTWVPLITASIALLGGLVAALRFNRQDAKLIVETQSTVMADMKVLNDELSVSAQRMRAERDELLVQIGECAAQVKELERFITTLRSDLENNAALAKLTIVGLETEVKRLTVEVAALGRRS